MRDFLSIGLEHLSGRAEFVSHSLRTFYIQTIFRVGFDQVARSREEADNLARIRGFDISTLDEPDREFVEALRSFKPLLIEERRYRNSRSLGDIERARGRL